MKRIYIFPIIIIYLFSAEGIFSELTLSGAIRNDSYLVETDDSEYFSDVLENKFVIRGKAEDWKFYSDIRGFLYFGEQSKISGEYDLKLMRSFVRYYTSYGDLTLGKTYINFGNPGIFNPFELDKNVIFSDLNYIKEGMLALEYEIPFGDLSGGKIYSGYSNTTKNYSTGFSVFSNLEKFDFGIVAVRKGRNKNVQLMYLDPEVKIEDKNNNGVYFKGDLFLGIFGGYNYHFYDNLKKNFNEANAGLDYSFFEGHLILDSAFYYNESGAIKTENYNMIYDAYFFARYYLYGGIRYIYDDFLSFHNACFVNLIDSSMIVMPSVIFVITNGLTATLQAGILTGEGLSEFSREQLGHYSILARVEGKF